MASSDSLTGKKISETYKGLLQNTSNGILDGEGNEFDAHFPKDVVITGSLTVSEYNVETTTMISSDGDSSFGNSDDDVHTFTGNVVPSVGGKYTLGLQDKPWKEVYVDSGSLILISGSFYCYHAFLLLSVIFPGYYGPSEVTEKTSPIHNFWYRYGDLLYPLLCTLIRTTVHQEVYSHGR